MMETLSENSGRAELAAKFEVFVVEDDIAMRESLAQLLEVEGFRFKMFETPQAFLNQFTENQVGCLLFDLRLPGIDGIELYKEVSQQSRRCPLIMISGNADIRSAVDAMKLGAINFLEKPFRSELLVESIWSALSKIQAEVSINARIDSLTTREKEFLTYIKRGMTVKAISKELNISAKTGHVHRRSIHKKMQVDSDAELVKLLHTIEA